MIHPYLSLSLTPLCQLPMQCLFPPNWPFFALFCATGAGHVNASPFAAGTILFCQYKVLKRHSSRNWFLFLVLVCSYGMHLLDVDTPKCLPFMEFQWYSRRWLPIKFHWLSTEGDSQQVLPELQEVVSCLPALVCGTSVNFYAIQWPNQHCFSKVWITSLVGEEPSSKFVPFLGTLPKPKGSSCSLFLIFLYSSELSLLLSS